MSENRLPGRNTQRLFSASRRLIVRRKELVLSVGEVPSRSW
jgi:hypothetical protein